MDTRGSTNETSTSAASATITAATMRAMRVRRERLKAALTGFVSREFLADLTRSALLETGESKLFVRPCRLSAAVGKDPERAAPAVFIGNGVLVRISLRHILLHERIGPQNIEWASLPKSENQ